MTVLKVLTTSMWAGFVCAAIMFVSACTDPCKNKICDHGYCIEGDCFCLDGYSGKNCEIKESDKFSGNYSGRQICPEGISSVKAKITNKTEDPRSISILIESYGVEILLEANIEKDSIFIPNQWVEITYDTTITNLFSPSKGYLQNDSILKFDLIYFYKKNDIDTCKFDLKKI